MAQKNESEISAFDARILTHLLEVFRRNLKENQPETNEKEHVSAKAKFKIAASAARNMPILIASKSEEKALRAGVRMLETMLQPAIENYGESLFVQSLPVMGDKKEIADLFRAVGGKTIADLYEKTQDLRDITAAKNAAPAKQKSKPAAASISGGF